MVGAANQNATGEKAALMWVVGAYLFHTFGELCLSPVGLSTVTKLAPARFVGQMMGVWFLASSLGKLMAGLIAGTFDPNDVAAMPGRYMNIVIYGCSVGLLLLLISRPVTRLMGGVR
jgi:POT family proton-dependent oligopeptide transporter